MSASLADLLNKRNPDQKTAAKKKSTLSLIDNDTSVGVEIEMENLQTNYINRGTLAGWERKSDGSLRGTSREFVTASPIKGDSVIVALEKLQETFEDNKFEKHKTLRTSMHVHINMLSLNREQLVAVLIAALLADKALFMMTEENREYLGFSRLSTEALAEVIANILAQRGNQEFAMPSIHSRYYSMNASALSKYGTLEFRHFATPDTIEQAVDNINACLRVKECGIKAWESAGTDDVRYDMESMYHLTRAQVEAAFGTEHEMPSLEEFTTLLEESAAMLAYNPDTVPVPEEMLEYLGETNHSREASEQRDHIAMQDVVDEWERQLNNNRHAALQQRAEWLQTLITTPDVVTMSVEMWSFLRSTVGYREGMLVDHIVKAQRPALSPSGRAMYDYYRVTETYVDTNNGNFDEVYQICATNRQRRLSQPAPLVANPAVGTTTAGQVLEWGTYGNYAARVYADHFSAIRDTDTF